MKNLILLLGAASFAHAALLNGPAGGDWGGTIPRLPPSDCISQELRASIVSSIEARVATLATVLPKAGGTGPQPYAFQPLAGTIWQDRFINNFVDLNSTAGIRDWDCTDFTYDGHQGHDIDLRSFGEQDIGSPIFAALDGTVVSTHDGEFDRSHGFTNGLVANYVILDHGNGHRTWYWHMRKNSVAVSLNQIVKAGTQLGLAGSSGYSTAPHLHFESQLSNVVFEPYAGSCQTATPGGWVTQTPIPRQKWIEVFAIHGTNFNNSPFIPDNPVRQGTFVRTGTFQPIGCWYIIHNQPANSTWRLRYLRPNATQFFDSGTQNFNNANPYRYGSWWAYYNLNPDIAGTWTLQLYVDGQLMVTAPFVVLDSGGVPTNRLPVAASATFDPPVPGTNDVVFCRVSAPLLDDPDYDLVRYRYLWKLNGTVIRDVTNAACSDAVPRATGLSRDVLSCTVTPLDGRTNGTAATVAAFIGGAGAPLSITAAGANFRVTWPTSGLPYTLEHRTNLSVSNWQAVAGISQSGGQNVVTNPGSGNSRTFRLRFDP
jgi:murein DD-endopeptidase MepM/ murein hydrolase activator NlpD